MRTNPPVYRSIACRLGLSLAALAAPVAHADMTWNSTGPTSNWSTTAGDDNWLPGNVVWMQNENAIFDVGAATVNVTTPITFNDITFGIGGFVIGNGAGSLTLGNDFASTITVTNALDSATISETIANNGTTASSLTKAGAGTLILNSSAASTYSGGTTISAGTLMVSQAGGLGTGAVTNNATLGLNAGAVTYTGLSTSLSGTGTVNVSNMGTGTATTPLNGNYSGFTGIWNIGVGAAAGAGKVQMNGADNAAATINVLSNATVYVSTASTHNAGIVLNGGDTGESIGQLRVEVANWAGSVTLAGDITGTNDGFIGANSGSGTISGVIGETGGARTLSKVGAGTTVLSGANTYSGGTSILAGTLSVSQLNKTGNAGNVGTGSTISIGNAATGATLAYTGAGETSDRIINLAGTTGGATITQSATSGHLNLTGGVTATGVGAKTLTLTGSTDATAEISGSIGNGSGTTAVTKSGTGTWILSAANSFTGQMSIAGGTLAVGNDAALGLGIVRLDSATIRSSDATTRTIGNQIDYANNFTFGSATTGDLIFTGATSVGGNAKDFNVLNAVTEFRGVISSTGTPPLTTAKSKSGPGTLVFSGANTYSGPTTINAGTLRLNYDTTANGTDASKLADDSALIVNGGKLELSGGTHTEVVGSTTVSGVGTITRSSGSAVLQLNAITHVAGGLLKLEGNGIATTDRLNSNGILGGGWAVMTNSGVVTGWATNSTNAADGPIVAYTGTFAGVNRLGGTIVNDPTSNARISEAGVAGNITLGASPLTEVNSLQVSATTGLSTVVPTAGTDVLRVGDDTGGGILVLANAGGLTIGTAANDGVLTTGGAANATAATLSIINESTTGDVAINSAIANNGTDVVALSKTGAGTLVLNGSNTFGGALGIGGGKVKLGSSSAIPATAAITVNSGATLDLNGNSTTAVSLAGAGTVTDAAAGPGTTTLSITSATATIANLITNGATRAVALRVTNSNNNAFLSNSNNTFSGGITLLNSASGTRMNISAAVTTTGAPGAITSSNFGTGPITVGQGATDKAGIFIGTVANNTIANDIVSNTNLGTDRVGTLRIDVTGIVLSGQLTANLAPMTFSTNGTGGVTVAGKITGPNGLTLLSHNLGGTSLNVALANTGAANDYAGDTIINQNPFAARSYTLTLGAANQIPNGAGKGNVVINTATTGVGTFNLSGFSETINGLSGNGTVNNSTGTATLTVGDNDATGAANTFSGVINGTGLALTKIGAGTLALTGTTAHTYNGATTVSGGTLQLAAGTNSTSYSIASGAVLDLTAAINMPVNATISGAGTLRKSGAGILQWTTTAATFNLGSGALIDVQGGTLVGGSNANEVWTNNLADLNVASGATFQGVEANVRVDALSGSGTISSGYTGAGYLNFTFGVDNGSGTFAGVLANGTSTGNFVKAGSGAQTLGGTNTYTGTTTVDGGTLLVTGSISGSATTVNSAGTLGGTGTVAAVNVVGGTVAPGVGAGTLSTGDFSLDSASTIKFELAQAGTVGGGINDLISVTGALTLDGTLRVTELAGFTEGTYRLLNYTGAFIDGGLNIDSAFLLAHPGSTIDTATAGQVNLVVIPEPSAALSLLGGLGVLLGFRRRSRRA